MPRARYCLVVASGLLGVAGWTFVGCSDDDTNNGQGATTGQTTAAEGSATSSAGSGMSSSGSASTSSGTASTGTGMGCPPGSAMGPCSEENKVCNYGNAMCPL